jgi:hypothetical protein
VLQRLYNLIADDCRALRGVRRTLLETQNRLHGGLCAGCLVHCRQPDCACCVWYKPYPCPLAVIAQAALSLPVPG